MAAARFMVAGMAQMPLSTRNAFPSTHFLSLRAAPLRRAFVQQSSAVCRRRSHSLRALPTAEYTTKQEGATESLEYRVFFSDKSGKTVGPLPLQHSAPACPLVSLLWFLGVVTHWPWGWWS